MDKLEEFDTKNFRLLGDVLSHLYTSIDVASLRNSENKVRVSLIPNPSHLEANNPVALGKARSKMQLLNCEDYAPANAPDSANKVLCVQVHGDASFTGQGIVAETFCISEVPHFRAGGSVHVIVNNQLGFTTEAFQGRSSIYVSDLAKTNSCPVLHVNADYPEAVVGATRLAFDYQQRFQRDIVIDLICYRFWGHNEVDEPFFTQPLMYRQIKSRPSIPDKFKRRVGFADDAQIKNEVKQFVNGLNTAWASRQSFTPPQRPFEQQWANMEQAPLTFHSYETGIPIDVLQYIGVKSVTVPADFNLHPTLQKHVKRRLDMMRTGEKLDWATAEALAVGSLLYQGHSVRISGQDVGRGTFSHRHWMFVDQLTDLTYVVLNDLLPDSGQQGKLEVANSPLSEAAVFGFEYGMAVDSPKRLCIWEAQFGDFFNGAQVLIDTYWMAGERKWLWQNGLVMLLPHGMDGAGPEHSQCRLERFLMQTDSSETEIDGCDVNLYVANPTTPAQYFHLLRAQQMRPFRKPLLVVAPKTLLRHPDCSSHLAELSAGHFEPVLDDPSQPNKPRTVVFCSGKHYYRLKKDRADKKAVDDVALVRLEQLCPFPAQTISHLLSRYSPSAKRFVWAQEEPRNYGAWSFVSTRFANLFNCRLEYSGSDVLGTPAIGFVSRHDQLFARLTDGLFS